MARGNSTTESFNGRLDLQYLDDDWTYGTELFGMAASAELPGDGGDGSQQRERRTVANRYTAGVQSARTLGEHRQFTTALRYERDDFAPYTRQRSLAIGYGSRVLQDDRAQFDLQLGPGYRRAYNALEERDEQGFIGRGYFGIKYALTGNTELANTLLVEAGTDNTFAQNELSLSVAMNEQLALKAGVQARHNSTVDDTLRNTDTLTTMNLVYRFK